MSFLKKREKTNQYTSRTFFSNFRALCRPTLLQLMTLTFFAPFLNVNLQTPQETFNITLTDPRFFKSLIILAINLSKSLSILTLLCTQPHIEIQNLKLAVQFLQAKNFAPKINQVEVYVTGVKNQNIFFLNIVMTCILRGENFLEFFYEQDSKFPQEKNRFVILRLDLVIQFYLKKSKKFRI